MRIFVSAKPASRENKIEIIGKNRYRVYVKEPAVKGRANAAIIELLAHYFSTSKSSIKIVQGAFTGEKIIDILV